MNAHQRQERKCSRRRKRGKNLIRIEQFGKDKKGKLRPTRRRRVDPTERMSEKQLDQALATLQHLHTRSPLERALRRAFRGIYPRQRQNHAPA